MNIKEALMTVRDIKTPFYVFIGALEYLNLYREDNWVVDYCHILGQYVYIELDEQTIRYLDLLVV